MTMTFTGTQTLTAVVEIRINFGIPIHTWTFVWNVDQNTVTR